jgi:hypothetical protein
MKSSSRTRFVLVFAALAVVLLATNFTPPLEAAENAVAPEKNPPGDIPDSQVFVDYSSPLGFAMKVPEGWSRTDGPTGAVFADKYNTMTIGVGGAVRQPAPDVSDPRVAALVSTSHAVKVTEVKSATLKAGPAVVIVYSANSEPNPVTNKQIRLEGNRYLFYKNGKLATLDLTAPLGADNVDQWQLMANSFRWK